MLRDAPTHLIDIAVGVDHPAFSGLAVIEPVALVVAAALCVEGEFALSVSETVEPLPLVDRGIQLEGQDPIAVSLSLVHLSTMHRRNACLESPCCTKDPLKRRTMGMGVDRDK